MSQLKEEVISLIQALPDDCSLEEIQYHLYVRSKVERGIRAADAGEMVTQDEAEQRVREWLKSSGRSPR